jgi:ATP-dependent Clp protease, protease subunit
MAKPPTNPYPPLNAPIEPPVPGFNVQPSTPLEEHVPSFNAPQPAQAPAVPPDVYVVFTGPIDANTVQKIFGNITLAIGLGHKHVHMLFHSHGGVPSDGIALHNFFRALDIDLTLYNVGAVSSAAVIAYLGAKHRKTSKYGSFMIHKTFINPTNATVEKLKSTSQSLTLDDARTEAIFKECTTLSDEQWNIHRYGDLWLSADEALAAGIVTEVAEFAPPPGYRIYNV